MRLFVAINLPAAERRRIDKAVTPLRDQGLPVHWVEPDKFHITLKFLGEVRGDDVAPVEEALAQVAAGNGPFEAQVAGFGAFPTIRRPRVLWIGVEASPSLRCVKQDLEWALAEAGFDREARAFHPHLTLGRASDSGGAGAFRGLDEVAAAMDYAGSFTVKSLDLMRSRPGAEGPRYSIVSSNRLSAES